MAFAIPPLPSSNGPLLFQPTLSLAARRAQSKVGPSLCLPGLSAPKKKPALSLTLDLSDIPPKTRDQDSSFPFGNKNVNPPQLPSESELAQMTPQARITAENTVFNWSLGKKRFDSQGREIDDDDTESVVSLTHSSTSGSAASSSLPTPSTGKSLLEDGNFSQPSQDLAPAPVSPAPSLEEHQHQPVRRTSSVSLKSASSGSSRSGRTVAFLCLASKHVVLSGETDSPCDCQRCGTPALQAPPPKA